MINPLDLTGHRILVTGASSGIGQATAVLLSRLGATVVLVGRDLGRLTAARDLLEGDQAHTIEPFDLRETGRLSSWLKGIVGTGGPLAGMVLSAGIHAIRPLRELEDDEFEMMFRVNVTTSIALIRAFQQKRNHCPSSSVVAIASVAGMMGQGGLTSYSASKGALIAACRGLAVEFAQEGIRVNTISPGIVATAMTERTLGVFPEDFKQAIFDRHLLGIGAPEDVALAAAYLLGPTARWITGTNLIVDGGFSCH